MKWRFCLQCQGCERRSQPMWCQLSATRCILFDQQLYCFVYHPAAGRMVPTPERDEQSFALLSTCIQIVLQCSIDIHSKLDDSPLIALAVLDHCHMMPIHDLNVCPVECDQLGPSQTCFDEHEDKRIITFALLCALIDAL